jgi:DNA-binding transcriptional LysR family regulator
MELHQIRAFVTVARVGNLTKAAEVLCVTQPAVTGQIKGLEASLGVALFDRSGGRMALTRAGEQLLNSASAVMSAANDLRGAARGMQGELSGRMEVGMPAESSDFLRAGLLYSVIRQQLPLVDLHTRTKSVGELLDQVRGGALTGAFVIGASPPRDLQWISLRSITYRVAYPTRWEPEMQHGGWGVLAALPWVSGEVASHVHQLLRSLFEKQGLEVNVVMRSEDTATLETHVRAGSACALLREEVAVPGVERNEWCVWGHARMDAQLFFGSAPDRAGDPLVIALSSAAQAVWR